MLTAEELQVREKNYQPAEEMYRNNYFQLFHFLVFLVRSSMLALILVENEKVIEILI